VTAGPTTAITLTVPVAPDADWETVRSRMMAALAVAADGWTDQNLADPGVTLAEAAAFTLADLHRRIEQAGFDGWPIGWPAWLPDAQRHWHATLPAAPAADPGPLLAQTPLAEALAAVAEALEPVVRACPDRPAAARLLASPPWVAHVPTRLRDAVITTLRLGLVRRLAQDRADTVADAVGRADAAGGSRAQRDARAARELAADLAERAWLEPGRQDSAAAVWPEEVDALVARERRRLALDALAERATAVQAAATPQRRAAVVADLVAAGLSPAEAELASAGRRVPAGLLPEDLEAPDGQTLVWPPHPIQTLTCEPVVADDYARRARLHPGVRRAWAVPGRLAGVAWHGLPTPDPAGLAPGAPELAWAVDRAAAALTLVVEADPTPAEPEPFLRRVLRTAIGAEVFSPFPVWRDDLDAAQPHRVIADEVGAALLQRVAVAVRATLVVAPTADGPAVAAAAGQRIAAFFDAGRAPLVPAPDPWDPARIDGPWPPAPQPPGGWVVGEPVRFSEVVEVIAGTPDVVGVRAVHLKKTLLDPGWTDAPAGSLELPPGSVPVLDGTGCLDVEIRAEARWADA
jgi:hypothetical protein